MTTSTATTARRRPVGTAAQGTAGNRTAGRRSAGQDVTSRGKPDALATQGNTALAPAPRPSRGAPTRPQLRVAPPAPVSVPRAPFVALVLTVVVAGVLGILVLNTKINENAFTLNHLQDQQSRLDQQEQQLDQHLAELDSPNSLNRAAQKLGLIPAGTPAYLPLPNGQTVGVPQPAAPRPGASGH